MVYPEELADVIGHQVAVGVDYHLTFASFASVSILSVVV